MALTAEDRAAVQDVVALHGHLADDGEFDRMSEVFSDDVVYDVTALGMGELHGLDVLRGTALALGDGNPVGHHVTNVIVTGTDNEQVVHTQSSRPTPGFSNGSRAPAPFALGLPRRHVELLPRAADQAGLREFADDVLATSSGVLGEVDLVAGFDGVVQPGQHQSPGVVVVRYVGVLVAVQLPVGQFGVHHLRDRHAGLGGWVLPPATLLAPLANAKRDADGGCPVIEQQALAQLIKMGAFDRHLRRARKTYRACRDALLSAVAQYLPDWSVAGLHVWLRPPSDVDAAGLVSAAAARGVAIEAIAVTSGRTDRLAGLVLCYARLNVNHAAEAVTRIADAVREIGPLTNRPGEVETV